ncbi:MAG: hypothetical protein LBB59_02170 [Campylobacteraceae bacterium]|jgi:hypothetical protein|nr:hypothetical protein [Campylobacteraceae bacterium]
MVINLENRTPHELKNLLDQVKISDLPFDEKKRIIEEIQAKLTGAQTIRQSQILRDIDEGQGDMDDIGGE